MSQCVWLGRILQTCQLSEEAASVVGVVLDFRGLELQSPGDQGILPCPLPPHNPHKGLSRDCRDNWCFQAASSWGSQLHLLTCLLGRAGSPGTCRAGSEAVITVAFWDGIGDLEEGGNGVGDERRRVGSISAHSCLSQQTPSSCSQPLWT